MAVAKVVLSLNHDGVAYHQGDTVEANLDTLKVLESEGVVEKVIDAIDGEVVETKKAEAVKSDKPAQESTKKVPESKTNAQSK